MIRKGEIDPDEGVAILLLYGVAQQTINAIEEEMGVIYMIDLLEVRPEELLSVNNLDRKRVDSVREGAARWVRDQREGIPRTEWG